MATITRPLLVASSITLIAGCGSAEGEDGPAVSEVKSCASFTLEFVAKHELAALSSADHRVGDGAFGGGEIRILSTPTRIGAPTRLLRYDAATKALLGEQSLDVGDCRALSITYAAGTWAILSGCPSGASELRTVSSLGDTGALTTLFSFATPKAAWIAFDQIDSQYWFYGPEGLFRSTSLEPVGFPALDWGPTSGFDHTAEAFVFARDAFEGSMSNMIALSADTRGGELCKFDVEHAPGLSGLPASKVIGGESTIWMLTVRGELVEFALGVKPATGR